MSEKIYKMSFSKIYPMYLQKVEKKGRTKEELDTIIYWLTGYDEKGLEKQIDKEVNFEVFFNEAPCINNNADKIIGKICGIIIEEIEDEIVQNTRRLDKLIDELAKGKTLEKIFNR